MNDFSLASTKEILKEIGERAKQKRKKNISEYGNQKEFAKHIGMSYRSYQDFERSGKITLEKLIDVLRGLDSLEELQELLKMKDEDLFKRVKVNKSKQSSFTSDNSDKKGIYQNKKNDSIIIPDVFS